METNNVAVYKNEFIYHTESHLVSFEDTAPVSVPVSYSPEKRVYGLVDIRPRELFQKFYYSKHKCYWIAKFLQ